MKKNININKEEILKLHQNHKTEKMVLREQSGDLKSQLQYMIDNGQIPDSVGVVKLVSSNPSRMWAIKKESKKTPGTFVYLFTDGKYGTFSADGKFTFGPGTWKAGSVVKQEVKKVEPEQSKKVEPEQSKSEIPSDQVGPDKNETKSITQVNAEITQSFNQAVQSQTLPSKQQCRRDVESYYMAYKKKMTFDPKVFEGMKKVVQSCADQFKFEGPFTKTDDYLNIMSGRVGGGPLSSSPWRIKR